MSDTVENIREAVDRLPVVGAESTDQGPQNAPGAETFDVLVLDCTLRQSLATVRSLGSRGLRVAVLATSERLPACASRWCQQVFTCPVREGEEAYLPYLEALLDRIHVDVLITSSNSTVPLIHRYRERLERRVRIALPEEPALSIAINKERTLEVARRQGIPTPQCVSVRAMSEVDTALAEIGLPAVIKPAESWTWDEKQQGVPLLSRLVTTAAEARRFAAEMERLGTVMLFQQFIPGTRESVSLLYAQGQVYARYAQRHLHVVGGQSSIRQSIAVPADIGGYAEQLVRAIDLEGCAEVEFRRDNDGNPYLMEVNPRLWASTELAVRSGVDFPYLLYQWASGAQIDKVESYHVGGRMRYLPGDVSYVLKALAGAKQGGQPEAVPPVKALFEFCLAFFLPTGYDYVDWKDPRPIWTALTGFFRQVGQKVGKSLHHGQSGH